MERLRQVLLPPAYATFAAHMHLQALTTLRIETDKAFARKRGAEYRCKELQARLQDKDDEIASLRERLSLIRRLLYLADEWEMTQRELFDNNEKYCISD